MDRRTVRRARRQRATLARAADILRDLGRFDTADDCDALVQRLTDRLDGRGDIDHDYPV